MSFEKGWRQRRDAARARVSKARGNPAYREAMAERRLREMAGEHLAIIQNRHDKLVTERAALERELQYYRDRAAENNQIVGPSHPVVLRLAAIGPLIVDAAAAIVPAQAEYQRKIKESDVRTAEMEARHKADEARRAKAEAAASAAAAAVMTPAAKKNKD